MWKPTSFIFSCTLAACSGAPTEQAVDAGGEIEDAAASGADASSQSNDGFAVGSDGGARLGATCTLSAGGAHGLSLAVTRGTETLYTLDFGAGGSIKRWDFAGVNLLGPGNNAPSTDQVIQWTLWNTMDPNPEAPSFPSMGTPNAPWNINQAGNNQNRAAELGPITVDAVTCRLRFLVQSTRQWQSAAQAFYDGVTQSIVEYRVTADGTLWKRNIVRHAGAGYTPSSGAAVAYTQMRLADWNPFAASVAQAMEVETETGGLLTYAPLPFDPPIDLLPENALIRFTTPSARRVALVFSSVDGSRVHPSRISRVHRPDLDLTAVSLIYAPLQMATGDLLVYETAFLAERDSASFDAASQAAKLAVAPYHVLTSGDADYSTYTQLLDSTIYRRGFFVMNGIVFVKDLTEFLDPTVALPLTRDAE